jgi:hypothetical protein
LHSATWFPSPRKIQPRVRSLGRVPANKIYLLLPLQVLPICRPSSSRQMGLLAKRLGFQSITSCRHIRRIGKPVKCEYFYLSLKAPHHLQPKPQPYCPITNSCCLFSLSSFIHSVDAQFFPKNSFSETSAKKWFFVTFHQNSFFKNLKKIGNFFFENLNKF